jgi:uncharacterized protein (TIGR02145 family)
MKVATALLVVLAASGVGSSSVAPANPQRGTLVDLRDARVYPTVRVGPQVWMAANLAFVTFDSWCYRNDFDRCRRDGRLYPWSDATRVCPDGWRLPTDADWMALERALGMAEADLAREGARGTDQGARLRRGGDSGFEAPISGYRRPDGTFARDLERAAFWTSTEANAEDAWHRDVRADVGTVYRSPVTKTYALSVRCLQTAR